MTSSPPKRRVADRLLALFGVRLVLWLFAASVVIPHLLTSPFTVTDHYDEHYFYAHDDAARITVVQYHELPANNPYYCGGIPLAANPQDGSLAPDFWLRVFFGTGPGRRLVVLLFLVLGMEGMFLLARKHSSSALAAAAGAIVFAVSGRFFFMLEFGWLNMFGFELLPWVVLGLEHGLRSWRWRILGGFALAWMILAGGTYSAPYTILVVLALTLYDVLARLLRPATDRGDGVAWWRPFVSLFGLGVASFFFAAAKVLPMLRIIAHHPRITHGTMSNGPFDVLGDLLTSHSGKLDGIAAEGYIGLLVAVLALGALLLRDKIAIRWMSMVCVFFALSMGDQGSGSLWTVVHSLPLYKQLRNPERFTLIVAFFAALTLARTLSLLEDLPENLLHSLVARWQQYRGRAVSERIGPRLGVLCGILGAVASGAVGYEAAKTLVLDDRMHQAPFSESAPLAAPSEFRQARGNRWDAQVWAPAARGTLQCFEETEFDQSPLLRGDLAAEEFPLEPTKATVERLGWSPNRIRLQVHASAPTTIAVNQNFQRQWSSSVGKVFSHDGELAVQVPAGDSDVELHYVDGLLDAGIALSLLSSTFAIFLLFGSIRDRWRRFRAA